MCVKDVLVVYQFAIPLFELIVFAKIYPSIGTKEWSKDEVGDFLVDVLNKKFPRKIFPMLAELQRITIFLEKWHFSRSATESLLPKVTVIPEMSQVFGTRGLLLLFVVKYR